MDPYPLMWTTMRIVITFVATWTLAPLILGKLLRGHVDAVNRKMTMTMTAYQIVWIVAQMMTRMMKIMIICAKSMTHALQMSKMISIAMDYATRWTHVLQILSMHVMGVKDRIQYSKRLVPPTRNGHGLCYFFALDVYYYVSLLLLALSSSRKKKRKKEREAPYTTENQDFSTTVEIVDSEQNASEFRKHPLSPSEKRIESVSEEPDEVNSSFKAPQEEIFAEVVDEDILSDDGVHMAPDVISESGRPESPSSTFAV